jgi:uncharacterized protein
VNEGQTQSGRTSRIRPVWLVAGMGFLVLAGFFSVLLRPSPKPSAAGEPPATAVPAYPRLLPPVERTAGERVAGDTPVSAASSVMSPPAATAAVLPSGVLTSGALPSGVPASGVPKPGVADPAVAGAAIIPAKASAKPRVAILVANLGITPALAQAAIMSLPAEIGLGFSPYGTDLARLTSAARAGGHEVWVGIPMQPRRYPAIDPGKNTLLVGVSATENIRRFDWALAQVPGPRTGFYNMMGSAFTADGAALRPVLLAAGKQSLFFLDAKSGGDTQGPKIAAGAGVRAALASGFLDDDPAQLAAKLAALVKTAKASGAAVGLVEPDTATFAALASWRDTLAAEGVELVPVSNIIKFVK